jgi:hypothetical protein
MPVLILKLNLQKEVQMNVHPDNKYNSDATEVCWQGTNCLQVLQGNLSLL